MPTTAPDHGLKIFSTCPPSALAQPRTCVRQLQDIARWSEDAGCEGMLVFTDNSQLDPWLVSQVIIEATERLCPLVAIQPVHMHPLQRRHDGLAELKSALFAARLMKLDK
jgi:alkanesulfonate monooxygenase